MRSAPMQTFELDTHKFHTKVPFRELVPGTATGELPARALQFSFIWTNYNILEHAATYSLATDLS